MITFNLLAFYALKLIFD